MLQKNIWLMFLLICLCIFLMWKYHSEEAAIPSSFSEFSFNYDPQKEIIKSFYFQVALTLLPGLSRKYKLALVLQNINKLR